MTIYLVFSAFLQAITKASVFPYSMYASTQYIDISITETQMNLRFT
jgi:hypothetical protein